jgi:anti-sigma B factor antagonist
MAVEVAKLEGAARVVVAGEIDSATSPQLAAAIDEAMNANTRRIEIDASAVTFIDSAGLRVLVAAQRAAEDQGRRVYVVSPSETTERLLAITGLTEYLLA